MSLSCFSSALLLVSYCQNSTSRPYCIVCLVHACCEITTNPQKPPKRPSPAFLNLRQKVPSQPPRPKKNPPKKGLDLSWSKPLCPMNPSDTLSM
ncbi:hypothetical protein BGZ63DRAFT_371712 [Mariannaea sp. PMI_226]|nr:hypothetical protein BGZ63DRAFT_371712 [Mariannaea sp. PMI_226]